MMAQTKRKPHFIDIGLRVEQLNRNGIDYQVVTPPHNLDCNLLPADSIIQLAMAKAINDNMARLLEDSKGKFICGASIPLKNFETVGAHEMLRAIGTLGLKVVSLPSNLHGVPLDSTEFESF